MRTSLAAAAAGVLALLLMPGMGRTAAVNGSGRTLTVDCGGGDAAVNGSGNRVVFRGRCRALRVAGSSNQVEIELAPGGTIDVVGTANHVLYGPVIPPPVVNAMGVANEITAGAVTAVPAMPDVLPPPAPQPGTIVLAGDGETNDVTCAGCDVRIHGSNSRYRLRGGLQSITVEGHADHIRADLEPGGHIAINGNGITLDYTLTRDGPDPVVSIAGNGNQVNRVQ